MISDNLTMADISKSIRQIDQTRRELIGKAKAGHITTEDHEHLVCLESWHHDFSKICRGGYAPLNPMRYGIHWGSKITHETSESDFGYVREDGLIEYQGQEMTLLEATRQIADKNKKPAALGGWITPLGRLGDLAGLNPVSTSEKDIIDKFHSNHDADVSGQIFSNPDHQQNSKLHEEIDNSRKQPEIGQNYDLFR